MVAQILLNLSPIEILGLTIIGEARGEPIEGQVAVGCVIRNRLHSDLLKYKSYTDVCLMPKQFSCWNPLDSNYAFLLDLAVQLHASQQPNDPYIRQCLWVANGIANWNLLDNTRSALHYITQDLFDNNRPTWARNPKNIVSRGKQVFFSV